MEETRCFCCDGPFSIVTGSLLGPKRTPFCGTCMEDFAKWVHGHTRRRWHGMRFYDHAGVPPEVDMTVLDSSIPKDVLQVLQTLKDAGHQAYLVGGCVRDLLRGRTPKDYDVATSATPEQVQGAFQKVIPTGILHGTVTVILGEQHIEVTTFRSEGEYRDGRRPETVVFEKDIRADLSRRDFTMNAIAYDPVSGELVDPFCGQQDIRDRVIRVVGDAVQRFTEDGLRPMRAVRFAATMSFDIESKTLAACSDAIPSFRKVSIERVSEELSRILVSDRPDLGVHLLRQTGMLAVFLPEIADFSYNPTLAPNLDEVPSRLELRLAALLYGVVYRNATPLILKRLKFPTSVIGPVDIWLKNLEGFVALRPSSPNPDYRRFASKVGRENVEPIARLCVRHVGAGTVWARMRDILDEGPPLTAKELALNGKDVMSVLGVPPGPVIGQATSYLLNAVLDDPSLNTAEALTAQLRTWNSTRCPGS